MRPLGGHQLANGRRDLGREDLDRRGVVAYEDERSDAVGESELRQLLDPLPGRAVEEAPAACRKRPADVQEPPDRAGIATGADCGLVDGNIARGQIALLQVRLAGEPAVGLAAGQRQHPGLVGTDPEVDVVRRSRAARRASERVVRALHAGRAGLLDVPQGADHVDRLLERVDALAGCPARTAHGLDPIPERAGTET